MAKARALDKRRRSIRNIRKITRTMELIATARFKKAMDRAGAATAYTKRITQLVSDLASSGLEVSHPLLEPREKTNRAILLVIAGNRGLCGGYNSNVFRQSWARFTELRAQVPEVQLELSGKRPIAAYKYRGVKGENTYTHFDDKPTFGEVELLANRYLEEYATGKLDRLDVAYTRFETLSKQVATVETLLPLSSLTTSDAKPQAVAGAGGESMYEFLPSAASILEEVVPTSFKVKLSTDNADKLIKSLGMQYNRARQGQITSEIMEVLGGVEAMKD
jgi:F-type H+-transporting ATPase subunit gamma